MRLCSELSQVKSNPRRYKAEVGLSIGSRSWLERRSSGARGPTGVLLAWRITGREVDSVNRSARVSWDPESARSRTAGAQPRHAPRHCALIIEGWKSSHKSDARCTMRASGAKRATRTERAGEAARERACRGVRGVKPLGSYSCRRAVIGSIRDARIAGSHAAPAATVSRTMAAIANDSGSIGCRSTI